MTTDFYVEVWLQSGHKAEHYATLAALKDAVVWLDERLAYDPQSLQRLPGYTDDVQDVEMLQRGNDPG